MVDYTKYYSSVLNAVTAKREDKKTFINQEWNNAENLSHNLKVLKTFLTADLVRRIFCSVGLTTSSFTCLFVLSMMVASCPLFVLQEANTNFKHCYARINQMKYKDMFSSGPQPALNSLTSTVIGRHFKCFHSAAETLAFSQLRREYFWLRFTEVFTWHLIMIVHISEAQASVFLMKSLLYFGPTYSRYSSPPPPPLRNLCESSDEPSETLCSSLIKP